MSIEDKELDEMFHGEEKPLHPDTVHEVLGQPRVAVSGKETTITNHAEKKAQKHIHQPTHDYNGLDNLKACAKWVMVFGGLSFLLFYWKEAGLMAESIAVPSIAFCTMLAGWGVGINARRGQ